MENLYLTPWTGQLPNASDVSFIALHRYRVSLWIEGSWQSCVKQGYWHHFSKSICSHHVSVSHFGNYHNISDFFITIIFVIVINDLCSVIFDVTIVNCFGVPWTMPMKDGKQSINVVYILTASLTGSSHLSPSPWVSLFPETQKYWN